MHAKPKSLAEKVTPNYKLNSENGCWEWLGAVHEFGHGRVWHKGKDIGAHRASWMVHIGAIPTGMCVLHKCDNPPCINPQHLFLGTRGDNNTDRCRKGRNGNCKLTEEDIKEIRSMNGTYQEISDHFDMSIGQIWRIKNGESWRHVK